MSLFPDELALANLKGQIPEDERGYSPREEAYASLKEMSGEDYGDDVEAWTRWVESQKAERASMFGTH
jgi:hypothetical protein